MSSKPYSRWVDTHCHFMTDYMTSEELEVAFHSLDDLEFAVYIGTDKDDLQDVVNRTAQHPKLYGALGIHPKHAEDLTPECDAWIREQVKNNPRICALGEFGLDYFRNSIDPSVQKKVFEQQLQIAVDIPKPVVIHSRESIADCLEILDNFSLKAPLVFHCFTGTIKEAEEILKRGFWLSYTGVVTFPRTESLADIVRITPQDRIMVETDTPFLAPVPYRGKINRPGWVSYVGEKIAEIRGWSVEEAQQITTSNAYRFFQLPCGE